MQRETDKIGLWQTYRNVLNYLSSAQKAFVEYLMNAYIKAGVDELGKDKYRRSLLLSSAQSQKASAPLAVPHRHDRPSRTSRGDSM